MAITLSREAYRELVAVYGPDEYPKNTAEAVMELRSRGFDATRPRLDYMLKLGQVAPSRGDGRNYQWSESDVDRAADILAEGQLFTPSAVANNVLGVDYAQYLRALWQSWRELEKRFPDGRVPVNPNSDWFVMHVHPPRMTHGGWVEFTPCEDILKGLKAKPAPDFIPIPVRNDELTPAEREIEEDLARERKAAGREKGGRK